MAERFPRHSIAWKIEELTAGRRLVLALPLFATGAGVVLRLYLWAALGAAAAWGWAVVLVVLIAGVAMLCGLATLHLANFTLRAWRWRAPAFGAYVALGEVATSLVLTLLGQERVRGVTATLADWVPTSLTTLVTRVVAVSLYALVLAAVVTALRRTIEAAQPGDADQAP